MLLVLALGSAASPCFSQEQGCRHPAVVLGHFDARAPNCVVLVRKGKNQTAVAQRLAKKYQFNPYVLKLVHGFIVNNASVDLVARLRCEQDVESIEYDQPTSIT